MKKVFTNSSDVIHLFASQVQNEGRCSNVFFETPYNSDSHYGTKIYSYGHHYLLGEFIDKDTIVINDKGYSSTTAGHISQLRYATSHKKQFFVTETDLKCVLYSVKSNVKSLVNARKPEKYILPSLRLFEKLNEFIEYTNKKELKNTIEYKEIETLINAINDNPKNSIDALTKFEKNKKRTEKRLETIKRKKELKEFRTYKRNRLNVGGIDYLRLSKDGIFVETSQNVSITIEEAKKALKLIDLKKIVGQKIDDKYLVTAINGALKVGCHNIPIEEVEKIRLQLTDI